MKKQARSVMIFFMRINLFLFAVLCAYIFFLNIQFDRKCEGHLKRAAYANTIEVAKKELAMAINYMEKEGLTSGYTSILYTTPDEDVGFWYENIKSAYQELEQVNPDATQLEKTNVLMKLRETLMDGNSVTVPSGIYKHPNNFVYVGLFGLFCVFFMIGGFLLVGEIKKALK